VNRREFVSTSAAPFLQTSRTPRAPNVVLLITDDQGYGDLSLHGNQHLKTPNLDRIGTEGVQFTQFQVCPVCSPTRSSLMTGRYNYRTGVVDTYLGRSMMYPDEVTLAEMLGAAGYRTGIFGKWHLGDNYPLRAIDQGFQEALVCSGGGLTQPSDPPGNSYFNPWLKHNGKAVQREGYCTDIFMSAAIDFIETNRRQPFFAYIATNAPHTPLQIGEEMWKPYAAAGLDETTAKVYGMVRNVDDNVGRLHAKLRELDLERDTILMYLTDNGPQQQRYVAGMRGRKGTVYQGGIRVPFFLRWPARLKPARIDRIAAHIDLFPTLAEACGAKAPTDRKIDGRSLMPLLRGESGWSERTLFTQWHRGDEPQLFRACAARTQEYKLIDGKELYDLTADPGEKIDIASQKPEVAAGMRRAVEEWFADVSATRGYAPPRIQLGAPQENPVTLTRQDWRGTKAGWDADSIGHWEVEVARAGRYEIRARMAAAPAAGAVELKLGGVSASASITTGATQALFPSVTLATGPARLEVAARGVRYVDVRR